jgi:hypothetical protein
MKIIRRYTAFDGTQMVVYEDNTGYQNTVPLYIYKQIIKKK